MSLVSNQAFGSYLSNPRADWEQVELPCACVGNVPSSSTHLSTKETPNIPVGQFSNLRELARGDCLGDLQSKQETQVWNKAIATNRNGQVAVKKQFRSQGRFSKRPEIIWSSSFISLQLMHIRSGEKKTAWSKNHSTSPNFRNGYVTGKTSKPMLHSLEGNSSTTHAKKGRRAELTYNSVNRTLFQFLITSSLVILLLIAEETWWYCKTIFPQSKMLAVSDTFSCA